MIYFTVLHLSEAVYLPPYGFTKITDLYISVEDEKEIQMKAQNWLNEKKLNVEIVDIKALPAVKQDPERYLNLI